MTFKRIFFLVCVLSLTAGAVVAAELGEGAIPSGAGEAKALTVRTFTFKYKQPDKAAAAIKSLLSSDATMSIQPGTNSLVVTDHPENLKAVSKALTEFDAAPQAFRLYVRLVSAAHVDANPPKIADHLRDVAAQLAMFRYNSFESAGEANVEGKEGDPGIIDMQSGYRADFHFGDYDPASDSIKVNDFHLSKLQGAQKDQLTSLLKTSLNLRLGQTYILGAAKAPQSQRALMIVLVARR